MGTGKWTVHFPDYLCHSILYFCVNSINSLPLFTVSSVFSSSIDIKQSSCLDILALSIKSSKISVFSKLPLPYINLLCTSSKSFVSLPLIHLIIHYQPNHFSRYIYDCYRSTVSYFLPWLTSFFMDKCHPDFHPLLWHISFLHFPEH